MAKKPNEIGEIRERLEYLVDYVTGPGIKKDLAETFPTRDEFNEKFNKIMEVLDAHTKLLKDLNQERLFYLHRLDRLEDEINKIKARLGMGQNS